MPQSKPNVALVSAFNGLTISTIDQILLTASNITIYTGEVLSWEKHIEKNGLKSRVTIYKNSVNNFSQKFDYIIFFSGYFSESNLTADSEKDKLEISKVFGNTLNTNAKIVFVLPLQMSNEVFVEEQIKLSNLEFANTIYAKDIFGTQLGFDTKNDFSKTLKDFTENKTVHVSDSQDYFPIDIESFSKQIVRHLFSFGSPGEKIIVQGQLVPGKNLIRLLTEINPNLILKITDKKGVLFESNIKTINIQIDVAQKIFEFIRNFKPQSFKTEPNRQASYNSNNLYLNTETIERLQKLGIKVPGRKINRDYRKIFKKTLLFLAVLLTPLFAWFILTLASLIFVFLSVRNFKSGKIDSAASQSRIAGSIAQWPRKGAELVYFSKGANLNKLTMDSAEIINKGALLANYTRTLFEGINSNAIVDLNGYSDKLSLEIEFLYNQLSTFKAEAESQENTSLVSVGSVLKYLSLGECNKTSCPVLSKISSDLLIYKKVAAQLPDILGQVKPKTYLFLFQNNMELRPTGGFIGSIAIVKVDKGKLTDMNVLDVYSADGQLKGHVEPPVQIKNYLGEANWYLRDANWDPDFPTSAAKIEWFLDKEMDIKVDGVIAVDVELAKSLLLTTGPLTLQEYNLKIDANNLYEVTQKEVEKDFFPGSRKKSNFLTSLVRNLIQKITDKDNLNSVGLAKAFWTGLETKHVQLFFHNPDLQKNISNLNWDGKVSEPECFKACTVDWIAPVDANLGVNKANYFIKRKFALNSVYENQKINNQLLVTFTNTASTGSNISYKNYFRLLLPNKAEITSVGEYMDGNNKTLFADLNYIQGRLEAGIWMEVPAGKTKTISFFWQENKNIDFAKPGLAVFALRKQAGTQGDTFSAKFTFPKEVTASLESLDLTGQPNTRYNTLRSGVVVEGSLNKDVEIKFHW